MSRSLAIDPKNPETLAGMGNALSAAGRSPESAPLLQNALAIKPTDAAAHYGLALILINEQETGCGDPASAVRPAIRSHVGRSALRACRCAAGRNEFQQAADQYSEAVRLHPNYDRAWNNLGVMMMKLGQTDRAIDDFAQAVARIPITRMRKRTSSVPVRSKNRAIRNSPHPGTLNRSRRHSLCMIRASLPCDKVIRKRSWQS